MVRKVKLPQPDKMYRLYTPPAKWRSKTKGNDCNGNVLSAGILICDEPTTALDVTVQKTIMQLIKELQQEQNMGVIFITHDLGVVAEIADRVAIMYKGEIVEEGLPGQYLTASHPYTKALIACRPSLHPKGKKLPSVGDYMDQQ